MTAKDGSRRAYEFTGDLLKDHEGNPSSICVIGRDVTRREAAEENVRRQNEFLSWRIGITDPSLLCD